MLYCKEKKIILYFYNSISNNIFKIRSINFFLIQNLKRLFYFKIHKYLNVKYN